jgi:hypothetical protein
MENDDNDNNVQTKTRCKGVVQRTKVQCTSMSSYIYKDLCYCGIHIKQFNLTNLDEYLIKGAVKRRPVGMSKEDLYREIFAAIIGRIDSGNVPEEMQRERVEEIGKLGVAPESKKLAITMEACRLAGTKENLQTIMRHMPEVIARYEEAYMEQEVSAEMYDTHYDYMKEVIGKKPRFKLHQRGSHNPYYISEKGQYVEFLDCDIHICNCSILCSHGYTLEKWCENPLNIYMGPSRSVVDKEGNESPEHASEWYLPNPETFRQKQNIKDVRRIMGNIESGLESKEKYLSLVGKTLGCVCVPYCCHCEVYVMVVMLLQK